MALRPAIFLDRDGTIIEDRGYLRDPSEVRFIPGAAEALAALAETYLLFMVTNQTGVGKGLLTMDEVDIVNQYVRQTLADAGAGIVHTYVCPHLREDNCPCIKPKPHFLELASRDYGIDLAASFAIGDHPHDVTFAENAGARGIYVLTGHGVKHRPELPEDTVVVSCINAAAQWIRAHAADRRQ